MKTKILMPIVIVIISFTLSGCATVFGGAVTQCQRTKPSAGQPSRAVRPVAAIADVVLFWPGLVVDFATGAIYKPCDKKVSAVTVATTKTK
jgi:hypothetical protein